MNVDGASPFIIYFFENLEGSFIFNIEMLTDFIGKQSLLDQQNC